MIKNNLPPHVMSILEHQELTQNDFKFASDFEWLIACDFDIFTARYQRGKWRLKIGHYIGVLLLPSGISLEILPKTAQSLNAQSINESRRWVCQMLSDLTQHQADPKQKALGQFSSHLATNSHAPALIDWLMAQFLSLLSQYSPITTYQSKIQSQAKLQGKLVMKEQLKRVPTGKLICEVDSRSQNSISNRLIKSALLLFARQSSGVLKAWQPILPLSHSERQQLNASYQRARQDIKAQAKSWQEQQQSYHCLDFAFWLLRQQAHLQSGGVVLAAAQSVQLCLFINMNQAFERWAGLCIASELSQNGGRPVFQPRDIWLYDDNGAAYLSIQPDLLIYESTSNQPEICSHVIDMKWKLRAATSIRASDAYQLTSYAQAYQAKHIWLVFPVTTNNIKPICLQPHAQAPVNSLADAKSSSHVALWLMPFNVTTAKLNRLQQG